MRLRRAHVSAHHATTKMTDEIAALKPYALIMAPTRELAQQIEGGTLGILRNIWITASVSSSAVNR